PQSLYIDVTTYGNSSSTETFLNYSNGTLGQAPSSVTSATFSQAYPTYLESPSGNLAFWGEARDGKTTLFTGNEDGTSPKQIANLTDYTPYGWFTDSYLLVE